MKDVPPDGRDSRTTPDRRKTSYEHRNFRPAAESQLEKTHVAQSPAGLPVENLQHEIQVRQIELEMQNEELRRAHLALEESRDRYLDLFEFAPVGYLTLTGKGLIAEINLTGATLLGVERKKLLLRPFSRYVSPECIDQYHLKLSRLSHDNGQQSCDMQIKRENGELRDVHMDGLSTKDENGAISLRVTLTDITECNIAEDALKKGEYRWKFAIEGAGDGVWDTNLQTGETKHSKRWKEMLGYTENDILPTHQEWLSRIHPDDQSYVATALQDYLEGKTASYVVEYRLQCKDGRYKWILSRGMVVSHSEDGKPMRMIGTHTDITERKQAEQDLRIAATAFEAQEGIMVADKHRIIIRINKAFTQLTGYSAGEAVGQPVSLLKSGQHDASFYQAMWEAINHHHYWQGEICDRRKNGELFSARVIITAVVDGNGCITHYVGSFLDITQQKQLEKVLLEARRHFERQLDKMVTELNQIKEESVEVNTALKVMMKLRETEGSDAKNLLTLELKQEVMPFLQRLKNSSHDPKQTRLISALHANLHRLILSYGRVTNITSAYHILTPKEIQVATMVREGVSTKAIAATLSLSPETISIHRKNIRKKLGLDSKAENLRSYLITFNK